MLSGRETRTVLETAGFSSWHARTALRSGLLGEPVRTAAGHLYAEERVRALAERPVITWRSVLEFCPHGIFVARRDLDATHPREALLEGVSGGWDLLSPWEWVSMCFHLDQHRTLPFVATVAGVVVLGADIVGARRGEELILGDPGPWFEHLEDRRFPTGPGRSWILRLPRRIGVLSQP